MTEDLDEILGIGSKANGAAAPGYRESAVSKSANGKLVQFWRTAWSNRKYWSALWMGIHFLVALAIVILVVEFRIVPAPKWAEECLSKWESGEHSNFLVLNSSSSRADPLSETFLVKPIKHDFIGCREGTPWSVWFGKEHVLPDSGHVYIYRLTFNEELSVPPKGDFSHTCDLEISQAPALPLIEANLVGIHSEQEIFWYGISGPFKTSDALRILSLILLAILAVDTVRFIVVKWLTKKGR